MQVGRSESRKPKQNRLQKWRRRDCVPLHNVQSMTDSFALGLASRFLRGKFLSFLPLFSSPRRSALIALSFPTTPPPHRDTMSAPAPGVELKQAFRQYQPANSAHTETVSIPVRLEKDTGKHIILFEEIQDAFPHATCVMKGRELVPFELDENFCRYIVNSGEQTCLSVCERAHIDTTVFTFQPC